MKWSDMKGSRLAIRYVIPSCIILISAVLIGYIVYDRTSRVLQEEVEKANVSLLEQGMTVLDNRMKETDLIVNRMTGDERLTRFQQIQDPFSTANLYKIIETREQLKNYNFYNSFILQYYIVFKNSQLLLNDNVTARLADIHNRLAFPEQSGNFIDHLINQYHYRKIMPAQSVLIEGQSQTALPYIHSFGFPSFSHASVIVLLDYEEIRSLFQGINISNGGWAYITDGQGNIISQSSGRPVGQPLVALPEGQSRGIFKTRINAADNVVTCVTSSYNGWKYVAVQPAAIVLEKLNYIQRITFFIFLVFLLVGLAAAFLAWRNSKPVQALIAASAELEGRFEQQLPFVRSAFFERLLRGDFHSLDDIRTLMKHAQVNLDGDWFAVAIVYVREDYPELNEKVLELLARHKYVVSEAISRRLQYVRHIHDIDDDKLAILMAFDPLDRADVAASVSLHLAAVQEDLQREYHMTTVCSVGGIHQQAMDISRSYHEAEQALVRSNENMLVRFDQLGRDDSNYYYPDNIELRLANCVKSGDESQLEQLLGELHQANFADRNLPVLMLKLWLFDMWATLMKLNEQMALGELNTQDLLSSIYKSIETREKLESIFREISQSFLSICRLAGERKKGRKSQLLQDIRTWIEQNYMLPELSVMMVADKFNVSEAYLSRSFREQAGVTFFDYLEQLRLERTKQLLSDSRLSIGDIAAAVGYNSLNTFGRAFKRATGISAMEYRELQR